MIAERRRIQWPDGKSFAFTFIDDTDKSTVDNTSVIYEFLSDHGLKTTKTVWPLAPIHKPLLGGSSLEDPPYRAWVEKLQRRGFEIGMHGTTDHSSTRARILKGFDFFRESLGQDPRIYINHTGQKEGIYWGAHRLDGPFKFLYKLKHRLAKNKRESFCGHVPGSKYFWGDVCARRVTYVRNFVFKNINTLACDSAMPYHDPRRPYVPFWFSASEAAKPRSCAMLLNSANQDRLLRSGGACVAYAHFGFNFAPRGKIDPAFKLLIRRLSQLPGWFVPVSTLLDFLRTQPPWRAVPKPLQLYRIQLKWLLCKWRHGRS